MSFPCRLIPFLCSVTLLGLIQLGPLRCGTEVGNPQSAEIANGGPGSDKRTSGIVYKGPVENAQVTVYRNSGQAFDDAYTSTDSVATGFFQFVALPNEPLFFEAVAGSYVDESRFPSSFELNRLALFASERPNTASGEYAVITPLSTLAAARIERRLESEGVNFSGALPVALITDIINTENSDLAGQYGLESIMTFVNDPFTDSTGLSDDEIIALLLPAGLSVLSEQMGFDSTDELLTLLADDYTDGVLDGINVAGQPIAALDGLAINTEWEQAISDYLHPDNKATYSLTGTWNGGTNFTGLTQSDWEEIKASIPAFQ